jgi:phosphatidylserine/phosphatidylglycerophosphate/cardiolipin synthase-like enzyme
VADFAGGKIQAYVGPSELGAADDLETVIVEFINGANKTLDIAVQELDSEPIAQAILDARWRGVDVQMFVEQDYLRTARPKKALTATPVGNETEAEAQARAQWEDDGDELDLNRRILAALLRSDIEIRGDYNPAIFHQKFVLRDYRGKAMPTSGLLTGSANFTGTDTHKNLNHIVIFNDHRVCRDYLTEVQHLGGGDFGRGSHGEVPKVYDLNGVPVKVLFAPDHTPELELIKQMLRCEKRLDFAIFTFSGSSGVDDAMVMLARAKRKLRGVLDAGQGRQWWAATEVLHGEKIEVFLPKKSAGVRKVHHKLMVIDDHTVVAGSMNYTQPANEFNDENIFVIGSPFDKVGENEVDHDECAAITGFLRDEVDRIITDLSEPYTSAAKDAVPAGPP